MQHLATTSAIKTYTEMQELESVQMLATYLYRPEQWYAHHYRFSNSVMHRIVLGEGLVKSTPELKELQRVTIEFLKSIGDSFVDFFPLLARLPRSLQLWRSEKEEVGRRHQETFEKWWRPVKHMVENGTAPPSFVRNELLNEDVKYTGNDEQAMYLALSTISAGSDNTRMTMNTFVMAALCYPNEFQKARKEGDAVCGGNAERLPLISDIDVMPYTCALVKEVLRWRPVVPLIPPHQLTQDMDFEDYRFPAGTEFLINSFPVCNAMEEPDRFMPERWLNGDEGTIAAGLWVFGGGRRVCAGYKLAQTQLFGAFSRLAYCFDYTAVSISVSKRALLENATDSGASRLESWTAIRCNIIPRKNRFRSRSLSEARSTSSSLSAKHPDLGVSKRPKSHFK